MILRPALGLLQGIITYLLLNYGEWSYTTVACILFITTFPLFALQIKLPQKKALPLSAAILGIITAVYGIAVYHLVSDLVEFESIITPILLAQCSISLLIVFVFYCVVVEENKLTFPYVTLFNQAWQVIIKVSLGKVLVFLTWGLCWLAASLFSLLNISMVQELVNSDIFFYVMPFFFFGIAMEILQRYEDIIRKLRNIALAFCQFLYPIFVVINLSFLLIIPFTYRAFVDFWQIIILLAALNIILFNGIYQAGLQQPPYHRGFRWVIYASMLMTTIYAMLIIKYPLLVMMDYGLKPYAFVLLVLLIILALYNACYTLAIVFNHDTPWLSLIKPFNTGLAVAVALVYLIMAMPGCHIGTLSSALQKNRLMESQLIVYEQDPYIYQGYLANVDLKSSNLQNKNLSFVDLSYANLESANLSHSQLENALLKNTNLTQANLAHANLKNVHFIKTNLTQANLNGALLEDAEFEDVIFDNTDLSHTDLRSVEGIDQKLLDSACGDHVKLPENLSIKACH